jgi:hypothetical protein
VDFVKIEPFVAAAIFLAAMPLVIGARAPRTGAWMAPAAIALAFFVFSGWTIASEGLLGFWRNHNSNLWGNQVWTDLLMAIGAAFYLITPRARAAGMNLWLWFFLIVCTGSIALYGMLARLLLLEERRRAGQK